MNVRSGNLTCREEGTGSVSFEHTQQKVAVAFESK
jgi:hypothetical protein